MPIRQLEAAELGEILGSLMTSVIQAEEHSARATVSFIGDVGFERSDEASERLRTVKLRYKKRDENDTVAEFEVEVPLIAMVNVPSLLVKEAKISLSYDVVTTARAEDDAEEANALAPGSRLRSRPARMTGFIRRRSAGGAAAQGKQVTGIDVDVTLEQQALPIGLERLLDLAELGITEARAEDDTQ